MFRGIVLGIVAALCASAGARADTIAISSGVLTYSGHPTAASHPFVTYSSIADEYSISGNQVITSKPVACSYVNEAHTWVDCPASFSRMVFEFGSGNDSLLAPEAEVPLTVNAGDGTDDITAGLLPDIVNGGGGPDVLRGDGVFGGALSHDELDGGAGDDVIGGRVGNDVIRGGDGVDEAYYGDRSAGVTVTLDGVANDGEAGESDNVHGDVEVLRGGFGNDSLTGNALANTLIGGDGGDRLAGLGGVDTFTAGDGADVLDARDGLAENVNCGDAADEATVDTIDVPSGCETVAASAVLQFDADGDGLDDPADCNDVDAAIRPGAIDVPDNGVDEDCAGGDAVNLDRDGDGFDRPQDCDDGNAAINPGAADKRGNAVDEDCAGGPAPFLRVQAEIVNRWLVFPAHTVVGSLKVRNAPDGARVELRCRGRGCPLARRRAKVGKELRGAFAGAELRPGAVVEVRVLRARMIAKVVRYRIRDGRGPQVKTLCLPPGKEKPRAC